MMRLKVNGKNIEVTEKQSEMKLIDFLREELDLTGVKHGCDIKACGTCAVLINNKALRTCNVRVKDIPDADVLTIEGMENPDGTLHPLQQAFIDNGAVQCGYCTPGMILTAHAFLLMNNHPTREEIRHAIRMNICRCTGYQQIVNAIESAAKFYK
jgi:carbon-monoxide dehydrogenase small subunit